MRLNALACYAVLLLAAGNWEVWITQYNLQSRFKSIDGPMAQRQVDFAVAAARAR